MKSPRRPLRRHSRFSKLQEGEKKKKMREGERQSSETLILEGSPVISQISGYVRLI